MLLETIINECEKSGEPPRIAILTYLYMKFIDSFGSEPGFDELQNEFDEWNEKYSDYD